MTFRVGTPELDRLIGEIPPRYMLLVVGHPGAGKTTLASHICYANASKGHKCLYISFYEDKEKLFRHMARLGIDLAQLEAKNLLNYVKMPVMAPDELLSALSELLTGDAYRVVIVDSINPLMELYRKKEQRAILLNFFYNIITTINGLLVAIAEIPWESKRLGLGAIEFVADSIIYLTHRTVRGLLVRSLELRKLRGAPLNVVDIPFDIAEGKGLIVYPPRRPERSATTLVERLKSRTIFEMIMGAIHRGDIFSISTHPSARSASTTLPFIDLAVENDMKILLISYKYSPDEVRDTLETVMTKILDLDSEEARWIIGNYIHIESINPASISIPQLSNLELRLIDTLRPGIAAFHACEIPWRLVRNTDEDGYWASLLNQLTCLKNQGIVTVRYFSNVDPHFTRMCDALADVTVKAGYRIEQGVVKEVWRVWRRGSEPVIVDFSKEPITRVLRGCAKLLRDIVRDKMRKEQ